uniref:PDZ domain-containing protein n=1 Tax=Rhabditophanes sp. KR3021 TaxID=114890 RepID=A0AC35TWQ6_9BILA
MASFYPSLEDMSVDQYISSHYPPLNRPSAPQPSAPYYFSNYGEIGHNVTNVPIYEAVGNNCSQFATDGLAEQIVNRIQGNSIVGANNSETSELLPNGTLMVAPVSMLTPGLSRSVVHHGVRTSSLYKQEDGKVGLRLRCINMGMFVQFVAEDSPASYAGIRFGDQILQIDGTEMLGVNSEKAMTMLNKSKKAATIELIIRDRPFERSVTLHKGDTGSLGFAYDDNKITHIIKDTSASRNGLLINQRILEVNGINVLGLKSAQIGSIIDGADQTVTLTIMSNEMYNEILKNVSWSLILKKQDHSVPE